MPRKATVKDTFAPLSSAELNLLRGKSLVRFPVGDDVWRVFGYIDWLEYQLDEKCDTEDALGTEGWRRYFRHPDGDN